MVYYVGKIIKKHRQWKELSLADLAQVSGIHRNYLSEIERGAHDPSIKTLAKIAGALEMPISQIFKEAEDEEENDQRANQGDSPSKSV